MNLSLAAILSGAAMMLAVGWSSGVQSVFGRLWNGVRNRILFSVELDNTDPAFNWIRAWVADHAKARYLSAGVLPAPGDAVLRAPGSSDRPEFFLYPRGLCTFRFKGRRIVAWTSKESLQQVLLNRETITLQSFRANRQLILDLLVESHAHANRLNADTVEVWIPDGYGWMLVDRKAARPADSLCLADGVWDEFAGDAARFKQRRDWYATRGIPYRRGYLLKGPPGNGKSSLAHAIASHLGMHLSVANVTAFADDAKLTECLSKAPANHILLLEDVDCLFRGRDRNNPSAGASFSGLLNALDGACAKEGRIVVMTTNHPEVLDPALIRPGRADVQIEIGNATVKQAAALFGRFFPSAAGAEAFGRLVAGKSMAFVQGLLLLHWDNPSGAIEAASTHGDAGSQKEAA